MKACVSFQKKNETMSLKSKIATSCLRKNSTNMLKLSGGGGNGRKGRSRTHGGQGPRGDK